MHHKTSHVALRVQELWLPDAHCRRFGASIYLEPRDDRAVVVVGNVAKTRANHPPHPSLASMLPAATRANPMLDDYNDYHLLTCTRGSIALQHVLELSRVHT